MEDPRSEILPRRSPELDSSGFLRGRYPISKLLWVFLIIAFIGFIDASYLTISHFLAAPPPCGLEATCETVTTSSYAKIGTIPVALLGACYYLSLILLSIFAIDRKSERTKRLAFQLTWAGLIASIYFVSLQFFVLKSIFWYCMLSAVSSTLLFILGQYALKKQK